MLQTLRDKLQGWIAGVIVGLLIIAFGLWGIESYLGSGGQSNVVAKVNGVAITQAQWDSAYERLRNVLQAQRQSPLVLNQTAQAELRQEALQQLITSQVLTQAALKAGYRVTQSQIDDIVTQMSEFKVNGYFSPERFQQILSAMGYTQEQFLTDLSNSMLVDQVKLGIVSTAFALPNEVQFMQQLLDQKRDIGYFVVPAKNFLNKANPTEADINAYYQSHQEQFRTPERVSIEYLMLDAQQIQQKLQPTAEELSQYYAGNQQAFTKNGKVLPFASVKPQVLRAVLQQKTQQAFSDQSQQLSDMTFTNPNSLQPAAKALGLTIQSTDFFTRDGTKTGLTANPKIINTAYSDDVLKQNNNSNLITLDEGKLVVLRIKNHQPMAVLPLANVKSTIVAELQQQQAQHSAVELGNKIIAQLKQGQAPEKLASQYGLKWNLVKAADRHASGVEMPVLIAAFSLPQPVVSKQLNAGGAELANGDYAVVALYSVKSAVAKPISQQAVLQQELTAASGQTEYDLYTSQLTRKASIKLTGQ